MCGLVLLSWMVTGRRWTMSLPLRNVVIYYLYEKVSKICKSWIVLGSREGCTLGNTKWHAKFNEKIHVSMWMLEYFERPLVQNDALNFDCSGAVIQSYHNLMRVKALESAKCRLPWCWLAHLDTYVIHRYKKQLNASCDLWFMGWWLLIYCGDLQIKGWLVGLSVGRTFNFLALI